MQMNYFSVTAIAAAAALSAAALPAAAADMLHEKVTDTSTGHISPQQKDIISSAADKVLRRIAQARGDLHEKDYSEALSELKKADTLLVIIAEGLPTTKVKDHIWVAHKHLQYENTKTVLPDFVPIYSSLDDISGFVPTQLARRHLNEARKALKKGKKQAAGEGLRAASAALIYTEEDLPLHYTTKHVHRAETDIKKKHYKQADKVLKSAEDSVNYLSLDVPSPLTVAKDALDGATDHYFAGEDSEAKAQLSRAIRYLDAASHGDDELSAKMSAKLTRDAKALLPKLAKHTSATKDRLAALLERVRALSERDIESYSTAWDIVQGADPIKPLVIEAQLHIAYAETDAHILGQSGAAKKQLNQALTLLKRAHAKTDKNFATPLTAVEKEVTALEKETDAKSAAKKGEATDDFETTKGQLRQMIMEM